MLAAVVRASRSTRRIPVIHQCPVETAVQFPAWVTVHELQDVEGQLVVTPLEVRRAVQHGFFAEEIMAVLWRAECLCSAYA